MYIHNLITGHLGVGRGDGGSTRYKYALWAERQKEGLKINNL
jgi:hypothetical protein